MLGTSGSAADGAKKYSPARGSRTLIFNADRRESWWAGQIDVEVEMLAVVR